MKKLTVSIIFLSIFFFLLLHFCSADVVSINGGGDNNLVINSDQYIEGFFFKVIYNIPFGGGGTGVIQQQPIPTEKCSEHVTCLFINNNRLLFIIFLIGIIYLLIRWLINHPYVFWIIKFLFIYYLLRVCNCLEIPWRVFIIFIIVVYYVRKKYIKNYKHKLEKIYEEINKRNYMGTK